MSIENGSFPKQILKVVVTVSGLVLGIFTIYKLFFYLIPFILAFVFSILIEPVVGLLSKKLKLSRPAASAVSVFLVLCMFGLILVVIISRLIAEIVNLSETLPGYFNDFYRNMDDLIKKGTDIYLNLPGEVTQYIGNAASNLSTYLMKATNSFLTGVLNTAAFIPGLVVFILVTILATYFFLSDRDKIYVFFESILPKSVISNFLYIKNSMLFALLGYVKAQLILMTVTFVELYTGLLIIGVEHPLIIALLASFIDALPIIGVGSVLIPWSVYSVLTGNIKTGIAILILYVIVLVVRQTIEPKILSQQIGIHPLLTLLAMYTGLQLFGILGLILGPITVLLAKNILSGVLKNRTIKDLLAKPKNENNK
ncbi:MAG: sporulation integral membrane protein YtvI [Clostridia bacterium]|nr:sporulation integral membrane protein YtvI [Clostridia bacterium]